MSFHSTFLPTTIIIDIVIMTDYDLTGHCVDKSSLSILRTVGHVTSAQVAYGPVAPALFLHSLWTDGWFETLAPLQS